MSFQERADREYLRQLGKRIQTARQFRGFSMQDFASEGGSPEEIAAIEAGEVDVCITTLRNIAIRLEAPIYYFFGDLDPLEWFDEHCFMRYYRILRPSARRQVQKLVYDIEQDLPISS